MPKKKTALPEGVRLDYSLSEGVPTIHVGAILTSRAQVGALMEQLDKLLLVLPEMKVRKPPKKAAAAPRTIRQNNAAATES